MIHHKTGKRNDWGGDSEPSLVSSSSVWKRDFQDGEGGQQGGKSSERQSTKKVEMCPVDSGDLYPWRPLPEQFLAVGGAEMQMPWPEE